MPRLFRRSVLPVLACALGLASMSTGQVIVDCAPTPVPMPKAYLKVLGKNLSLVWNGDTGEAGRGRGEIFVTIWIYWPCCVEQEKTQYGTFGPLGGDTEFPSGSLVQSQPPNGPWSIVPATVPVIGSIYINEANCPVSDHILVEVLVWEEDSNKELKEYVQKITGAVNDASAAAAQSSSGFHWVQAFTAAFEVIIDLLTKSSDDAVGRFTGQVPIPDPCGPFFTVVEELQLENLCAALWQACGAESIDGQEFSKPPYNIQPPEIIGTLRLTIQGGPCAGKFCQARVNPKASSAQSMRSFDFGQPDEAVLSARIETGAAISTESNGVAYAVALDIDADQATGSPLPWAFGAEYLMSAQITPTGELGGTLLAWQPGSFAFVPIAAPLYEARLELTRSAVILSVERSILGLPPEATVSARGLVLEGNAPLDALPNFLEPPLPIPVSGVSTGAPPSISGSSVPHDGRDVSIDEPFRISFSKAMDRASAVQAVHFEPFSPFTATWDGDDLIIVPRKPLKHATEYQLIIDPSAVDTVGVPLDGAGLGVPGQPFLLPFRTAHRPIPTFALDGTARGEFIPGEQFFVQVCETCAGPLSLVYLVQHDPIALVQGARLVDVSSNGPDPIIASNDGPLVLVGSIAEEGEYNVVLDVDGDGIYGPLDLIDRSGIGFAVLPDCDGSGVPDAWEIAAGLLLDTDGDGLPDLCEKAPCPADLTGDGIVGAADLSILLGAWGSCPRGCVADLTGDGAVAADDLSILLGAWGGCR